MGHPRRMARDTKHNPSRGPCSPPPTFRLPGTSCRRRRHRRRHVQQSRRVTASGRGGIEEEHHAYGIPFPGMKERFDRLEEQLEIITGLWRSPPLARSVQRFSGRHFQLKDSTLPCPSRGNNPVRPVIVGGEDPKRTPRPSPPDSPTSTTCVSPPTWSGPVPAGERGRRDGRARSASLRYSTGSWCAAGPTAWRSSGGPRPSAGSGRPAGQRGVRHPGRGRARLTEWADAGARDRLPAGTEPLRPRPRSPPRPEVAPRLA